MAASAEMEKAAFDDKEQPTIQKLMRRLTTRSHVTEQGPPPDDNLDWRSMPELSTGQNVKRSLGLTWKGLTVKGLAAGCTVNDNVVSQFVPGFLRRRKVDATSLKTIIDNSSGCVKPGETLLVLGRPGAGCTTLLKVLANRRKGYTQIEGDVRYGSLDHEQAAKYQGQIVMSEDEDTFFPTLTAAETIDFATRLNMTQQTPGNYSSLEEARAANRDFLFEMLNVSHTKDTKVGNEYIRGVSGGERKRIGILEVMAARGSVCFWDNATRGLDANTALQFVRAVRKLTDLFGLTSVLTLYQAGNGIYETFDKVLVLEQGQQLFYGPTKAARPFMEDLGFICADGANVADFLTGLYTALDGASTNMIQVSQFPLRDRSVLDTNQSFPEMPLRFVHDMNHLRQNSSWKENSHFQRQVRPKH